MKLSEFLGLITDEEAYIELEVDIDREKEYVYQKFWLSDYREFAHLKLPPISRGYLKYKECEVTGVSFMEPRVDVVIQVKETRNDTK